jgi:hypothetical protein
MNIIMETILNNRKIRTQRIIDDVSLLKHSHPEILINGLGMEDMEYWQAMAKRLDSSVLANDITMQEIVDEVNAVRKERYEKQNRI